MPWQIVELFPSWRSRFPVYRTLFWEKANGNPTSLARELTRRTFAIPFIAYRIHSLVSSSNNGCAVSKTAEANECELIQSQLLVTTLQWSSEQDKQDCCKAHTFWTQPSVVSENQLIFKFHCQPLNWFDTASHKLLGPSAMTPGSIWAYAGRSYTTYSKDPKPSFPVSPPTAVKRANPNDSRDIRAHDSRWRVPITSIQTEAFSH